MGVADPTTNEIKITILWYKYKISSVYKYLGILLFIICTSPLA